MRTRILVIEDNDTNLELMTYLAKAFGYDALTAREGQEGLKVLHGCPMDLILCDLEMPGLSGFDVCRHIKTRPELQNIPLVAVSALAMVGDRERVLAAGFDGYITKPIDSQAFIRQIEAFLPAAKRQNQLPKQYLEPGETAPRHHRKDMKILVVDNSPINLALARETLEPFGYCVIFANDSQEAFELAQKHSLDLILSDMHMPDQDGLSFLRRVKQQATLQSIPFVFLSASNPDESERRDAKALGASKLLTRPIEPQVLLREIKDCLQDGSE
jgi:CheY-like chemotaxis protein